MVALSSFFPQITKIKDNILPSKILPGATNKKIPSNNFKLRICSFQNIEIISA